MRKFLTKKLYPILGGAILIAASIIVTFVSGHVDDKSGAGVQVGEIQKSSERSATKPVDKEADLAKLKADYHEVFNELEIWQGSTIDQMIVQAKADYVSGQFLKEDLIAQYQELALSLEAQADEFFEAIYLDLENDLKENGYSLTEAEVFRKEHERKKEERLQHVVDKLSDF